MLSLTHRQNKTYSPASQTALEILAILLRHGNTLGESAGLDHHLARIETLVQGNRPLELVLPAFPAKSPNRQKTISHLPDYAEVLGLERLQSLCDSISAVYAPGAHAVICSDGRVFSDLVLVSDEDVSAYGAAIDAILRERKLQRLRSFGMEEVFAGRSHEAMRAALVKDYARELDQVRADTLHRVDSRLMFNGIHRFVFEDRVALQPEKSRNRLREESKQVAYEVIQRSNAWSLLVESLFPHALRLSIHPQLASSTKIGVRLVDGENIWGTPWHNVAVLGAGGFRLMKKAQAEALGATLAYARGKYPYYKELEL